VRRPAWQLLVLGLASFCFGTSPAWAYVRELTSTGQPIAWQNPCVVMQLDLDTTPPVLTPDDVVAAATQAMATWSYPQIAGTDLRLSLTVESASLAKVGYDKKNVIVFRQDNWCREPGLSVDDAGTEMPDCYPSSALAVTSVFKNKKTGDILDADIEFNAVGHTWGDLVAQPTLATADTADFQNALTHELGHVVGLDHNCYTGNDGPRPYDNTGAPAVNCYGSAAAPPEVADATMYPSVLLSDTSRRTLTADDELGVCEIYPHAHEECPLPPSGGGCSLAPGPASSRHAWLEILGGLCVLLLATLLLLRDRRLLSIRLLSLRLLSILRRG
jgi:hypothetical protein